MFYDAMAHHQAQHSPFGNAVELSLLFVLLILLKMQGPKKLL